METTVYRDSSRTSLPCRVHAVRDADGAWHVISGQLPVLASDRGQWLHDGAGTDDTMTEAPKWLVSMLEPLAPEDWRMCRFELVSACFSRPDSPSRDDSVLLESLTLALRTERDAREKAEAELIAAKAAASQPPKLPRNQDASRKRKEEEDGEAKC